jgi:hypothetical protein
MEYLSSFNNVPRRRNGSGNARRAPPDPSQRVLRSAPSTPSSVHASPFSLAAAGGRRSARWSWSAPLHILLARYSLRPSPLNSVMHFRCHPRRLCLPATGSFAPRVLDDLSARGQQRCGADYKHIVRWPFHGTSACIRVALAPCQWSSSGRSLGNEKFSLLCKFHWGLQPLWDFVSWTQNLALEMLLVPQIPLPFSNSTAVVRIFCWLAQIESKCSMQPSFGLQRKLCLYSRHGEICCQAVVARGICFLSASPHDCTWMFWNLDLVCAGSKQLGSYVKLS